MGKEKPRLGRGLASLLGAVNEVPGEVVVERPVPHPVDSVPPSVLATPPKQNDSPREIPVAAVGVNPYQPRLATDPQALAELVESIRQHGIVQPIVVRRHGEGFELIAGQRRLEAVRQLERTTIPAIVREATDQQMLELALIENIHREDLNCVDRATAYKNYQDTFRLSPDQIAERLGQDRTTVTNYLRLLGLSEPVLNLLRTGRLSMGHARAIVGLESPDEQTKLAFRCVQLGLSVRQIEGMVTRIKSPADPAGRSAQKSPNILDLELQMTRSLSAKVQIVPTRKKGSGKVVIEYHSLDDFDRILDAICGPHREEL